MEDYLSSLVFTFLSFNCDGQILHRKCFWIVCIISRSLYYLRLPFTVEKKSGCPVSEKLRTLEYLFLLYFASYLPVPVFISVICLLVISEVFCFSGKRKKIYILMITSFCSLPLFWFCYGKTWPKLLDV